MLIYKVYLLDKGFSILSGGVLVSSLHITFVSLLVSNSANSLISSVIWHQNIVLLVQLYFFVTITVIFKKRKIQITAVTFSSIYLFVSNLKDPKTFKMCKNEYWLTWLPVNVFLLFFVTYCYCFLVNIKHTELQSKQCKEDLSG